MICVSNNGKLSGIFIRDNLSMLVLFLAWNLLLCCRGSQQECKEPLGMESGAISDKLVTASSTYSHFYNPAIGRLHHKAVHDDESRGGAWIALHKNLNQWLQIDLGPQRTTVKMVATQGRYGRSQWVKRYRLQYSLDGGSFRYYNKTFDGNSDQNTVVYNELNPPINARFIRFRPTLWKHYIAMRVELYGCHDLCRSFHLAEPIQGYTLAGHVIRSLTVEVESSCRVKCYLEPACVSFNMWPLADGAHRCELSNSDHHRHTQDLISSAGYSYTATVENFCLTSTCHPNNTLTCQSGFSDRGFHCVCKAGYFGNDCEEVALWVDAFPKMTTIQKGSKVLIACNATGKARPVVSWKKLGGSISTSSTVYSNGTLCIPHVELGDNGTYVCTATNAFTTLTSSVELEVFCSQVAISQSVASVVQYVGQRVRLSCDPPTGNPNAVFTWMFNDSATLPLGALVEASNALLISSLRKEHSGVFSCLIGSSLHWSTSVIVKFPETCTIVKQTTCDVSGDYIIDPDGEQGQAPFPVYCDMNDKGGVGVTAVSHDSEATTRVHGLEPRGSYRRDVNYINASIVQIKELIDHSQGCQQFLKYECKNSILTDFTPSDAVDVYAWWVSRDGQKMTYWGGVSSGSLGCACSVNNNCAKSSKPCNCDMNDNTWREDSGFLTDKSHLPVTQLRFGDTGGSHEEGYHTLGKLECYGTP